MQVLQIRGRLARELPVSLGGGLLPRPADGMRLPAVLVLLVLAAARVQGKPSFANTQMAELRVIPPTRLSATMMCLI